MRSEPQSLSRAAAREVARVSEHTRRVAASTDLATASRRLSAAASAIVGAGRSTCLFHDSTSGQVWCESMPPLSSVVGSGLVALAVQTGRAQVVQRCDREERWGAGLDRQLASGNDRLLLQPIGHPDVHAVIAVTRASRDRPFNDTEVEGMHLLAESVGPILHNLCRALDAEQVLRETRPVYRGIFRAEVVAARRYPPRWGDLVRVLPEWLPWAYRFLLTLAIGVVAYLVFGKLDVYTAGPAVVRLYDRTEVTAHRSGPIASVYVQSGQRVASGELLVRFEDADARAERDSLERAWASAMRRHLADPYDVAARDEVARLLAELADARSSVMDREILAPFDGVVSDLRIRSGQFMNAGEVVMSIARDDHSRRVLALLPGRDRPRIRPGMTMRLEFPGYPRNYQEVVVDAVGDEVIGPAEARRYLGPSLSDAVELSGSLVVVEARLPAATFRAGDETFHFHDGMSALAELCVQRKSIIERLVPAIDGIWADG